MVVLILKNWTFRKMLKAQIEEEGFDVLDFEDPDKLVDLKGSLVVIDLVNGGYTLDKLKDIKKRAGEVSFLVLRGATGFPDTLLRKEGFNFILRRPFSIGDIVNEVKNVLNKSTR